MSDFLVDLSRFFSQELGYVGNLKVTGDPACSKRLGGRVGMTGMRVQ